MYHVPYQVDAFTQQLDVLVSRTKQCMQHFTDLCTADRISSIVDQSSSSSTPATTNSQSYDPMIEFTAKPYSNYAAKQRSRLRKELLQAQRHRDHLTKLVLAPVLDNLTPAVIDQVINSMNGVLQAQHTWLMNYLKACEAAATGGDSTNSSDSDSITPMQRAWNTAFRCVEQHLAEFSKTVKADTTAYLQNDYATTLEKLIYKEMSKMREAAWAVKHKQQHATLNAARLQVFKDNVEHVAEAVLSEMQQYVSLHLKQKLLQGFVSMTKDMMRDLSKWFTSLDATSSSTLSDQFRTASLQLQQLIALDTETRRAGSAQSTVQSPSLITILQQRYDADDAQFLQTALAVQPATTSENVAGDSLDVDMDVDVSTAVTSDCGSADVQAMEIQTLTDSLKLSDSNSHVDTNDCEYSSETSCEDDDRSAVEYITGFYSRATAMIQNIIMPAIDVTCSDDTSESTGKHKELQLVLHEQLDIAQSIAKDLSKPTYQLIVVCTEGFGASDVCTSLCGNLIKVSTYSTYTGADCVISICNDRMHCSFAVTRIC
jgi:Fe-S cluster biosynthesis and repair protein YggX